MSITLEQFGIDRLPVAERLELAELIWESIGEPPIRLSDEQRDELHRRDSEMDADPSIGLTWTQIRARVEARR